MHKHLHLPHSPPYGHAQRNPSLVTHGPSLTATYKPLFSGEHSGTARLLPPKKPKTTQK